MDRMSFFDGTLDTKVAADRIKEWKGQFLYTHGLGYRHPTIYRTMISKSKALEILNTKSLLDITFEENAIHLNTYSDNDLY